MLAVIYLQKHLAFLCWSHSQTLRSETKNELNTCLRRKEADKTALPSCTHPGRVLALPPSKRVCVWGGEERQAHSLAQEMERILIN